MINELLSVVLKKKLPLLLVGLLLFAITIWFIPSKIFPSSVDFRMNLWTPAYLLVHRMSPYDIQVIVKGEIALWTPVIIGLFFPLGYLPIQWASNLWLIVNISTLFIIVAILVRASHKSLIFIPLTIFSLALFPSSMEQFKFGQVSLIICLLLLLLSKYHNQLKPIVIGLLLSLSITKPQLIVIFLPNFLIIYFNQQGFKKLLSSILYAIMWTFVFCLPLFLLFPGWISDYLSNLTTNPTWLYPSLYSYLIETLNSRGIAIFFAGLYLIMGIGVSVFLSFKLDGFESLLWSLALTTVFTPIIWSYDFVLVYPLVVYMVFANKSKLSTWITCCGFGIVLIVFGAIFLDRKVSDQHYIWVPLSLNLTLVLSYTLRSRKLNLPQIITFTK